MRSTFERLPTYAKILYSQKINTQSLMIFFNLKF